MVQATIRSGSLITARLALENGRDVYAVPGDINRKNSEGTNWLIKNGAKLVAEFGDVIEESLRLTFERLHEGSVDSEVLESYRNGSLVFGELLLKNELLAHRFDC